MKTGSLAAEHPQSSRSNGRSLREDARRGKEHYGGRTQLAGSLSDALFTRNFLGTPNIPPQEEKLSLYSRSEL